MYKVTPVELNNVQARYKYKLNSVTYICRVDQSAERQNFDPKVAGLISLCDNIFQNFSLVCIRLYICRPTTRMNEKCQIC